MESRASPFTSANDRPDALVFDAADVGIVGDWREVVPRLVDALVDVTEQARV